METWESAQVAWMGFEGRLAALRAHLRCSYRGAWFRGHEDTGWDLTPSAFRSLPPLGTRGILADFSDRHPNNDDLRRSDSLLLDDPSAARSCNTLESDVQAAIVEFARRVEKVLRKLQKVEAEIRQLTSPVVNQLPTDVAKDRGSIQSHREVRNILEKTRSGYATELSQLRQSILTLRCLRYGEKDAFILFRSRSSLESRTSSWEMLAAMQHYGAPTRLLDWTDTLAVAIYFATKAYRSAMVVSCGSIPNWLEKNAQAPNLADFGGLPTPEIWILNPYRLARITLGQNRIEDLSLLPALDYFRCFHLEYSWPYVGVIPITLPWTTPRLVAQRGYFTVNGLDCRPLDEQLGSRAIREGETKKDPVLGRISMDPLTAVYAVRHIVQFVGLDAFALFRDEDNLGMALREFMKR